MKNGLKAVAEFLNAGKIEFDHSEEKRLISFASIYEEKFLMLATTNAEDFNLHIYTILPIKVTTPSKKPLAAEFCVRVAGDEGRFEFDPDDGSVRFHATTLYEPGTVPIFAASALIGASFIDVARFCPALISVLRDGVSPKEAVEKARKTEVA